MFCFWVHGEHGLGWPQMGPEKYFPANPDLVNILGDMDLDFENFLFGYFFGFVRSMEKIAWGGPEWG